MIFSQPYCAAGPGAGAGRSAPRSRPPPPGAAGPGRRRGGGRPVRAAGAVRQEAPAKPADPKARPPPGAGAARGARFAPPCRRRRGPVTPAADPHTKTAPPAVRIPAAGGAVLLFGSSGRYSDSTHADHNGGGGLDVLGNAEILDHQHLVAGLVGIVAHGAQDHAGHAVAGRDLADRRALHLDAVGVAGRGDWRFSSCCRR